MHYTWLLYNFCTILWNVFVDLYGSWCTERSVKTLSCFIVHTACLWCWKCDPLTTDEELRTLADLAHSCADASGPSSPNQDKPHKSLAEAAMAYQEEHLSPPKSQPARVAVVTGEEEERNVLQVKYWVSCGKCGPWDWQPVAQWPTVCGIWD